MIESINRKFIIFFATNLNMKLNPHHKEIDSFNTFRIFYNGHLKENSDSEMAFKKANENFYVKYGFYPFLNFEEYLTELFKTHDGFHILGNLI